MKVRTYPYYVALFVLVLSSLAARATHLRSADIKIESTADPLTFKITLLVYVNMQSNTQVGFYDGNIYFGDGGSRRISDAPPRVARPDLGKDVGLVTYVTTHRYPTHGTYQVSYVEGDRSAGIVNIDNAGDVDYTTYLIFNTKYMQKSSLPSLNIPPLDRACTGNVFTHNPGAADADGDVLTYQLTTPRDAIDHVIETYTSPDAKKFYPNYNTGNELGTGPPTFDIDSLTGQIVWDAPGMVGEYNIAFKILEWRKDSLSDNYILLSTTIRDMQIVVEDCANKRPTLSIPTDVCVVAGTSIEKVIKGFDPEHRLVKIEAVSDALDFPADQSPATYSPFPPAYRNAAPQYDSIVFHWNTSCEHVRRQPYQVTFKISDKPPLETPLVTYATWNITVIAPAPVWKNYQLDLVKRYANLEWEPYTCANADKIQIWRRVDHYPYTQPLCEIGIPKTLDFDLVGEVDASQTTFIDTNKGRKLVDGAQYCYRLVATFKQATTTPSKVSPEICFDPIRTDAPVITHVSVEKTDKKEGAIRVSWRSPFDIDAVQFPRPYYYHIYRAFGFSDEEHLQEVGTVTNDTTFLDQAINTTDSAFNYRVIVYAQPENASVIVPVDTSAIASSERLTITTGFHQINLAWRDSVPWSNVALKNPWHVIYRGKFGDALEKYDSVDVSQAGFFYIDTHVDDNIYYSYRVKARGTYGNPAIALQENFSQIESAYPENNLLPCTPVVRVDHPDCDAYITSNTCSPASFQNRVHWHADLGSGCRQDIVGYNVYASERDSGEYKLIASITDTLFTDAGLTSFARCYKISAIDTKGEEGPKSDATCNDNCPYFALPNVFTPDGDGCNDVFSAYDVASVNPACPAIVLNNCPRFVVGVDLHVLNRWGREVYHYRSATGDSRIAWNGRDKNNKELESGEYFYQVLVTFNVLKESERHKRYKGIVRIVR